MRIYNYIAEQTNSKLNFSIQLQKDKRVYCFIGENGVGKTQLLENMARSLLYTHSLFKSNTEYNNQLYMKEEIYNILHKLKIYLPLSFSINDIEIKNKEKEKWRVTEIKNVVELSEFLSGFEEGLSELELGKQYNSKPFLTDKPIVFIGAKNRGYAKNINTENIKITGNRLQRFLSAFLKSYNYMNSYEVEETTVVDWFVSRLIINPNFVTNQSNTSNEVILVCKLLQELEPEKLKDLMLVNNGAYKFNIAYHEGSLYFSGVPFEKLSTGYISIIKIFQDIIDGYSVWKLNEKENINEVNGIVFIDEIESHLHPKWEQSIVPFLKKHFPNTIFYIATHSPLVVSSTEEGESYELIKEQDTIKAVELGNPRAWYMADIYSQAFHVDYNKEFEKEQEKIIQLTAEFSKVVKEYLKTKNTETMVNAENIYKEINRILPETDPRRTNLDNLKKLIGV